MATPAALLVSCSSSVDGHSIMKQITKHDDKSPHSPIAEDVCGYPWQVNNKYYKADILVCVAEPCIMGSLSLGDSMEGIVLIMDDSEQSFKTVKSQWSTVKEMNPEVRILACKQFTKNPGVGKQDVLGWCLDNTFELVELEKPEDEDEEEEDGFGADPYGVKRIISALHAHTWSNLEMKDDDGSHILRLQEKFAASDDQSGREDDVASDTQPPNGYMPLGSENENLGSERTESTEQCSENARAEPLKERSGGGQEVITQNTESARTCEVHSGSSRTDSGRQGNKDVLAPSGEASGVKQSSVAAGEDSKKSSVSSKPDKIDAMLSEDMKLFEALGNEDPQSESFEQLFSKMAYMKEKANSLEGEERRRYAEKVAIAFWRAVGGDQEEIDGLDDDDSD
ncbi:alpha- and gamma-adaptin-binding protein p34-like [Diadema setosum]|uniref:alpha- and gamma-adaptin-binding protein p34-like n=1 Tax=Diadema setosum TaxID=31175 RepID=UPI003B3BD51F